MLSSVGEAIEHAERQASDADRDRAAAVLRVAAGRGAIDIEELDQRLGDVFRARTIGQLASVTWDLDHAPPASAAGPGGRPGRHSPFRSSGFRAHFAAWALTNGFLTGIYVLTTPFGFPWPFFPAGGWGIGLGMHGFAASEAERKRAERQVLKAAKAHALPTPSQPSLPPAPVPGRRFVVAMFTDIAGSTRLNEALGDAEWVRVRTHHRALLQECFSAGGGFEVNALGDGFLARFESPSSAVRCAVAIQRRLEQQRDDTGFAPSVRIGIHSGDAVEDGTDILGAVINLASRVTSAAEPGEILITEPVADQLGDRHDVEDRGLVQLKGVNQARHLLAVGWH
jgi:class 3 adenylate cyclase